MIDPIYFLIPTIEVTRAHISLSVNPFVATADLPTRTIGGVGYVVLEVPPEHIKHPAFVHYRPYRLNDVKTVASVDNILGARAHYIGLFNIGQTTADSQDYTYTFEADRVITGLVIDVVTFEPGDKMNLAVEAPNGQGGWITANTPLTGWFLQSGRKEIDLLARTVPAGFRIKFTLTKLSTNVAKTVMTMNLQQFKVGS